ncbi:hypothetical protein LG047_13985 [Methylocystis sp. WRRC1]|uniref:hypothetical protein n=1 Tax=Methylocystis sp. WRRC1 TaxID=1732014 RepID=UPI001D1454BA|nr:hypothetical protein [Methylocystis sp. WRRC1]MCC3246413.1 hypothetical protein [Methylocystis sp. WRRC1]
MESKYWLPDIEFDAAVVRMSWLTVGDFIVADDAPQTYEEMISQVEGQGVFVVWSGGSERTIYSDPKINFAVRAWHDWCHWRGRHDFSPAGEIAVAGMQRRQLIAIYGNTPRTRRLCRLIDAEIVGQMLYLQRHGEFPTDQRAFVATYADTRLAAADMRHCFVGS